MVDQRSFQQPVQLSVKTKDRRYHTNLYFTGGIHKFHVRGVVKHELSVDNRP